MKIAGILINYRTSALTIEAVNALLVELATVGTHHVYVVENDSRDGSLEVLLQAARDHHWHDRVSILAAPRNGGYGYGINLAVRHALGTGMPPSYFHVINTDAFADPGTLPRLVAAMDADPRVGMAGGRVYGVDGVFQGAAFRFPSVLGELEQAAAFGLVSRLLRRYVVPMQAPATDLDVDWLPGTSMLIRREVFAGGVFFDEDFFLYFEEVDFARRLREAGWRALYVADAPVKHIGSVSTGLGEESKRLPDYWFDSRHRYFLKHHGSGYTAVADAAWVAGYLLYLCKRTVLGRSDVLRQNLLRDFLRSSLRELRRARGAAQTAHAPAARDGAANPVSAEEMGLAQLLAEDFATYDHNPLDPGFWTIAVHRLGRRAQTVRSAPARQALVAGCGGLFLAVDWLWGVSLPGSVSVGRRVRLRTGGGAMLLGARAIGNDVKIAHETTLGPLRGDASSRDALPTIEDGVEIWSGVSILGAVTVGRGAVIAPNSLVMRDVQPNTSVVGVPARVAVAPTVQPATAAAAAASPAAEARAAAAPATEAPLGLVAQLAEDFRAYDHDPFEAGLWVTAIHRVRSWADRRPLPLVRSSVRASAAVALGAADWLFGIHLPADVQLGRRVRIWHHGSIRLAARKIGDDVHIRPNTTLGAARGAPNDADHWPVVGDKADIGAGACILGDVEIGRDAFVGANSLVLENVPPGSVVVGVPSRKLPRRK